MEGMHSGTCGIHGMGDGEVGTKSLSFFRVNAGFLEQINFLKPVSSITCETTLDSLFYHPLLVVSLQGDTAKTTAVSVSQSEI